MSAICKTIAVHSSSTKPLMKYCFNEDKTSLSKNLLENPDINVSKAMDYASNPLKTICNIDDNHKELLVSGIKCNPNTAAQEFQIQKQRYLSNTGKVEEYDPFEYQDRKTGKTKVVKKKPVTAIHLIQSFEETDIDPHVAHQIGVELAERMGVQAVVCTHLNKEHIHNHIIINTYLNDKKVLDNLDTRMKIRTLSDDIQREYGIPINFEPPREQLLQSKRSISYREWDMQQLDMSWKEQMRQDILTIKAISRNRDEFLSMMESYGYKVEKETPSAITYLNTENGKKISDRKLGKEYTISSLFDEEDTKAPQSRPLPPHFQKVISVSKYNWDGTRRSALEMIIRKAIALIQRLGNFFEKMNQPEYSNHNPANKIKMLQEALDTIDKYKIVSQEQLNNMIDETGKELSHIKREVRVYEMDKPLFEIIQRAINKIEECRKLKTHIGNLYLHNYSVEEARATRSTYAQSSPSLKSDLSKLLYDNPEYKLSCKFNEMSALETEKVIRYLRHDTNIKPDVLVSVEEYESIKSSRLMDKIYDSRTKALQERLKKPATDKSIQSIQSLLEEKGITTDKPLSQFDVLNIKECFSSPSFVLLNEEEKEKLKNALQKNNLEINRDIGYVTKGEYVSLMQYMGGKTTKEPSLLSPFVAPASKDIENLKVFMKTKGISSPIPIEKLAKPEFQKFYNHVVSYGRMPECISSKETNIDSDNAFYSSIEEYGVDRSLYLSELRNAINVLRSFGYDIDAKGDLSLIKAELEKFLDEYQNLADSKNELGNRYRDFIKLNQTIKYAQSPSFVYGALYQKGKDEEITVEEKEEIDQTREDVEKKEAEKKEEKKEQKKEKRKGKGKEDDMER